MTDSEINREAAQQAAAQSILRETMRLFFGGWATIRSLASYVQGVSPIAQGQLSTSLERMFSDFLRGVGTAPEFDDLDRELIGSAAQSTKQIAETAIAEAQIVFAHSLIDEAVSESCRAAWTRDLQSWAPLVTEKSIILERVLNEPIDVILASHIKGKVLSAPMPKRAAMLLERCPPKAEHGFKGFSFDLERLRAFDDLRHRIVHRRSRTPTGTADSDAEISYVFFAGAHLIRVSGDYAGIELKEFALAMLGFFVPDANGATEESELYARMAQRYARISQ